MNGPDAIFHVFVTLGALALLFLVLGAFAGVADWIINRRHRPRSNRGDLK